MKLITFHNQRIFRRAAGYAVTIALAFVIVASAFLLVFPSPVSAAPSIFPSILPSGQVGASYSASLVAAPITGAATWTITSGTLPLGLILDAATGIISGTPFMAGTFSFFVQVTDSTGTSPQQGFAITVAGRPLTFASPYLPDATEGAIYSGSLRVNGGNLPYTFSITSGTLPAGLNLNPTSGTISGTPPRGTAGTFSFYITVTDSSTPPLTTQQSFNIIVKKGYFDSVVTITTSLTAGETGLYVDGKPVAKLRGGQIFRQSFPVGTTPLITVDAIVNHPTKPDIRFVLQLEKAEISETSPDATFGYVAEYYLDIKTDPPDLEAIKGSDWYREGVVFKATTQAQADGKPGTQYRFSYWLMPNGEKPKDLELKWVVSAPGKVLATYDTYYEVTVATPFATLSGPGWIKQGTAVKSTTQAQIDGTPGTQYRFVNWLTPTNDKLKDLDLNWPVSAPGKVTAVYDAYYELAVVSPYGKVEGAGWYKAGATAVWSASPSEVPMSGILGFFQGKQILENPGGKEVMNAPKTIALTWKSDNTLPIIFIPLTLILLGAAVFVVYKLYTRASRIPVAPSAPAPAGPTIVVVEGGQKPRLESTKEQLVEQFRQLLDKYEGEVKTDLKLEELPESKLVPPGQKLLSIQAQPSTCSQSSKKLIRTVAGNWRKQEERMLEVSPEEAAEKGITIVTVWARDIYNEWEVFACPLPQGHAGKHRGAMSKAYSLQRTVTQEVTYTGKQKILPPKPHFTDSLPVVDVSPSQVIGYEPAASSDQVITPTEVIPPDEEPRGHQ